MTRIDFGSTSLAVLGWFRFVVKCWVELGIVVHLELEVDAEAAGSGGASFEERLNAGFEIEYLFFDDVELEGTLFFVLGAGVGAVDLFLHVELFEGENGEAVDGHAWSLGTHLSIVRKVVADLSKDQFVHLFDEVVALLVIVVDGPLSLVDEFEAHVLAASVVFVVPESEVVFVVFFDQREEGVGGGYLAFLFVPTLGELGLMGCDG